MHSPRLSNSKFDLWIDTRVFVRMRKLRLLMICYSFYPIIYDYDYRKIQDICPSDGCKQHVRGDFEFLSHELRFLVWHKCPLNSLPSNFNPKNLLKLDMRDSHIQQLWEGIMPLKKLKVILLSYCKYLVKTPDLTEVTNLEWLVLDGCSSLIEVHPSISALQNLLTLSLKGCKELKIFPSNIRMKSLHTLDLSGCSNLDKFPEIPEEMEELTYLYLDETAIEELPSSINNLTGLVTLDLSGCRELKSLPCSMHMKSLKTLNLFGCSNIEKFPEISEVMKEITKLTLSETAIKELPSSIQRLQGLQSLSMRNCRSIVCLPHTLCNLAHLRCLYLSGCSKLSSLPHNLGTLESLCDLEVQGTGIKRFPFSILRLRQLNISLSCNGYEEMKAPFSVWSSLIRKYFDYVDHLRHLDLRGCNVLEISDGMAHLPSLESLRRRRRNNLDGLPAPIRRLGVEHISKWKRTRASNHARAFSKYKFRA